ncbi:hypothetical protein BH23CHL7_BH23CHL7_14650 [soil metagenome]
MIRNAIIHFNGRLPLLADLRDLPGPADQSLLATNVRTRDGKRPSFADAIDSWFLVPLREVLAIELPSNLLELLAEGEDPPVAVTRSTAQARTEAPTPVDPEPDLAPLEAELAPLELDEGPVEPDADLLARIRQF